MWKILGLNCPTSHVACCMSSFTVRHIRVLRLKVLHSCARDNAIHQNFKSNWALNFQRVRPGNPRIVALYANGALTLMLLQPTPLNGMRSDMSSNL